MNLAARLADVAVPGEVLADAVMVSSASTRYDFEPAGRRLLKGFSAPVAVVAVHRAAGL